MIKNHKSISIVIIGLIIVSITVAVFFLGTESPRKALDWIAFSFVLYSEFCMVGTLIYLTLSTLESNRKNLRNSILLTIVDYWIITMALALLRNRFEEYKYVFVIINIIITGTFSVILIIFILVAAKAQSVDKKTSNQMAYSLDMKEKLYMLVSNQDNINHKRLLNTLYEKIKYSDKVGNSTYDIYISEHINKLEVALRNNGSITNDEIEKTVSQIMFYMEQRDMELS